MYPPFSLNQATRIAIHYQSLKGFLFSSSPDADEVIECITPAPYDVVLEHLLIREYEYGTDLKEVLSWFDRQIFYTVLVLSRDPYGNVLHKRILDYCREFNIFFDATRFDTDRRAMLVYKREPAKLG